MKISNLFLGALFLVFSILVSSREALAQQLTQQEIKKLFNGVVFRAGPFGSARVQINSDGSSSIPHLLGSITGRWWLSSDGLGYCSKYNHEESKQPICKTITRVGKKKFKLSHGKYKILTLP